MSVSVEMIAEDSSQYSYVHGASGIPLIYDTIGDRLRKAAKLVSNTIS